MSGSMVCLSVMGKILLPPSEFDLSGVIREKGNVLAVEVYKKTVAAYLEDQDFFRFFGDFPGCVSGGETGGASGGSVASSSV